jgi:O-antigen/teichoic acid export membrane protein
VKPGMTEPSVSRRLSTGDRTLLSVAKGGGFLAAGSIFNYASRLVVSLVLARVLGVDDYGAYNLSVSLAFMLAGVGNLGLDAAMERYIAVFSFRGDDAGVRGTVRLGVVASTIAGILVAASVYVLAPNIAAGIFDERSLAPLFRLVALIVPVLILTTLLSAAMRGFRRMDYSAFAENFVQPLVRTVVIAGLAIVGFNAALAVLVFGLSFVTALAVLIILLRRRLADVTGAPRVKEHIREISVFSFPFWLAGLLTQFRQNVQPVLLGVFNDVASVGIFSVASSANLISHTIYLSITKALRPTMAELIDTGDRAETERLYRTTTRWTVTISLPVFIVMVLYPTAILGIFGKSFEAGAAALVVLAFSELANAATGTCGTVIDMSGYNTVKVVNKFVWIGLSLGLNVLLIPRFGIIGAAVAALGATATIQIVRVVEVWILAGLNPYDRMILKPVAAAAIAFAPGWAIQRRLIESFGTFELLASVLAVGLIYVGALILLRLGEDDRLVLQAIWRRARSWK